MPGTPRPRRVEPKGTVGNTGPRPRIDVREIRVFKLARMTRKLAAEKLLTKLREAGVQRLVAERYVEILLAKHFDK